MRCGFSPCVRKILWRRKWQPTPVLFAWRMDRGTWQAVVHGVTHSRARFSAKQGALLCMHPASLLRCFLKFCPQSHVCVKLVQQCMHQTSSSDVHIHPCVTVTLFFSPSKIQDIDEKKSTNEEAQTSLSGLR